MKPTLHNSESCESFHAFTTSGSLWVCSEKRCSPRDLIVFSSISNPRKMTSQVPSGTETYSKLYLPSTDGLLRLGDEVPNFEVSSCSLFTPKSRIGATRHGTCQSFVTVILSNNQSPNLNSVFAFSRLSRLTAKSSFMTGSMDNGLFFSAIRMILPLFAPPKLAAWH